MEGGIIRLCRKSRLVDNVTPANPIVKRICFSIEAWFVDFLTDTYIAKLNQEHSVNTCWMLSICFFNENVVSSLVVFLSK